MYCDLVDLLYPLQSYSKEIHNVACTSRPYIVNRKKVLA